MHKVITINRQSGSGGAYIGAKAAEELGIICYDKQLIQMALDHSKMEYSEHAGIFSEADEKITPDRIFTPRNEYRGLYDRQYALFRELYPRLHDIFDALAEDPR